MKQKTPETLVTNEVIEILHRKGYTVKKIYNGGVPARVDRRKGVVVYRKKSDEYKGIPDLLAYNVKTNHFMFIEVKTKKGRVKPEQQEFLDAFNDCANFEAEVFRSGEDALEHILEYNKAIKK